MKPGFEKIERVLRQYHKRWNEQKPNRVLFFWILNPARQDVPTKYEAITKQEATRRLENNDPQVSDAHVMITKLRMQGCIFSNWLYDDQFKLGDHNELWHKTRPTWSVLHTVNQPNHRRTNTSPMQCAHQTSSRR